MIGFYLTKNGSYSPEQIEDISNSFIIDDQNKSLEVMGEFLYDFQKLSNDYSGSVSIDSSKLALGVNGAREMYGQIDSSIESINSSVNALEEHISYVDISIGTLETSVNGLETWKDAIDSSIPDFIRDTSYGQGTVQDLVTGTDTTPKVWDASVINEFLGILDANAVRYKGDINAGTGAIVGTEETLTTIANKKGDVYVVSTEGALCGVELQVGDSIIFKKNVTKNTAPVASDISFV